jgi:hypothetical protein
VSVAVTTLLGAAPARVGVPAVNGAEAGGADGEERGAPGLGDGRLVAGGFEEVAGGFAELLWVTVLAVDPALPCPGRDRLINFHRPPSDVDGPPALVDDPRKDPEPVPHGCQPFGAEPARADEPAIASADAADPLSGPGTNVPAELRAYNPAPLPAPSR